MNRFVWLLCAFLLAGCQSAAVVRPFAPGPDGPTLVAATKAGDLITVWAALHAGAPPDSRDRRGNTALGVAASRGDIEIATALITYGASVDGQGRDRVTPLMLASRNNQTAVVTLLLEQGADPTIRDRSGRRAIEYALERGPNDPIAAMLSEKAAVRVTEGPRGS